MYVNLHLLFLPVCFRGLYLYSLNIGSFFCARIGVMYPSPNIINTFNAANQEFEMNYSHSYV